jgi:trehalose 6-phosphate phosphatase
MSIAPALPSTDEVAVFLDFDGTLVEIVDQPSNTEVPEHLRTMLKDAHAALGGALALITGRSIADLDALLAPLQLPAAGIHGLEYRDYMGDIQAVATTTLPAWARAEITELATRDSGLLLEDKRHSLALHYRLAPDQQQFVRDAMRDIFARLGPDFVLQDGKMVLEIRPAGESKGTAVARFMAEPPFAGRCPVFVGDDITDEDAFKVVNALNGQSIKVGQRTKDSAARSELATVDAVRQWLQPLTQ